MSEDIAGDTPSVGTYRAVLSAVKKGDVISFNNSGGANAEGTPELRAEAPPNYFVGGDYAYEVCENINGELEIWYGEKYTPHAPEHLYDTVETIEIIAEGDDA